MKLKYKCLICGDFFEKIGNHVKKEHKITPKEYYDNYLKKPEEGICHGVNCNNQTNFCNCNVGYNKYCSFKCSTTRNGFSNSEILKKATQNGFPLQNKEIYEKTQKTSQIKYKCKCYLSSQDYKDKRHKTWIENYKPLYTTGEILGRTQYEVKCRCDICGAIYSMKTYLFRERLVLQKRNPCIVCNEVGAFKGPHKASKGENEMAEYIKTLTNLKIIQNDRSVLEGRELDVFIPDLKLAFEYDGDFWHMNPDIYKPDDFNKIKNMKAKEIWIYDNQKIIDCKNKNISLIRIKESDWIKENNEIKEVLKNLICNLNA